MNNKPKPTYAILQWKIYLNITFITIIALIAVFLLISLADNRMANFTVALLQDLFGMTNEDALSFYHLGIRRNRNYLIYTAVAVFFIILSRYLISHFAKYFNEISGGLDLLVKDKDHEIKLSSELADMERKLVAIKQTLDKREQEARLAEQHKNDVVMYLAHDIKTPLTSIIGYLSLLHEAPDMPPDQKAKYITITLEKANQLEKLINEFFEITRYNFQTGILTKQQINLYYMLTQMTDEFYPLLNAKGKQAVLHIPEDMTLYGDPDKLARVFNNILKNAAAYSPEDSVINITATVSNGMTSIIFSNDGCIPKDKLTSIFDKFYRLDSARSSDTGGAGLGLAIAKAIVLSHNGRIYAQSDGNQTFFIVELPILSRQS